MDILKSYLSESSPCRIGKLVRVYYNNSNYLYTVGDIGIVTVNYYAKTLTGSILCSFLEYHDGVKTSAQVRLLKHGLILNT